jgi:hypothetical protein
MPGSAATHASSGLADGVGRDDEQLAVWSSRRPWLMLAGWALALVAAIAITAAFLGSAPSTAEEVTSHTESRRADDLRFARFAGERGQRERGFTEVVVVRSATATVDEPRFVRRLRVLARSCVERVRLR